MVHIVRFIIEQAASGGATGDQQVEKSPVSTSI